MKLWPKRSIAAAARVVSTFSLLTLLCLFAVAGPASGSGSKGAPGSDKLERILNDLPVDSTAQDQVRRIKSSPFYRDDQKTQSNWWERAAESFGNWLRKLFNGSERPSKIDAAPPAILGVWAIYLMWVVLACAALAFVALALKHFRWRFHLKRKSKALLEEDEPERSLDEWLERADALEAEGRYREAIRCLYLACLLRFDEARIARFDRGQTNWEHLYRIRKSPSLPGGLDFEPATQAFDGIWYGMRTRGQEDVAMFRAWYQSISHALMEKAA